MTTTDNPRPWEDESKCKLDRMLKLAVLAFPSIGGEIPCDGCNHDRAECGGRPPHDPTGRYSRSNRTSP